MKSWKRDYYLKITKRKKLYIDIESDPNFLWKTSGVKLSLIRLFILR